ncbi:MCE family protein [Mycolicibacterium brumae]|uniref:MCE family protein n=1 Tax=Mycolicibacterium brumae TaxID=85968 RepID=A0A2G5PDY8_9MYCO|nr:MCE family protein [Mycolicibacterium brumae]MCV7191884.1 MCE family protein [Mycolicibacterium brumae]PIB76243.1 MCE family protein [Mycolicibacterium brumae]RWA15737.1 hypothetical protein MBRU_09300 [Mycolicibacterium brumae DSM 44177]UWW07190.1 MCE family protein [Mycolicibacterium brumae]
MPNPYDINPRSPSLRRLIVIGAIFTVLAVIASILMIQKSQGKFDEFVRVTAALTDVGDGLPIRSDVKYLGVLVGSVGAVQTSEDGQNTVVDLDLTPGYAAGIPAAVTARVVPSNVFAVSSVQLVPPEDLTGPKLQPGSVIPEDDSLPTQVFQTALSNMRALMKSMAHRPAEDAVGPLTAIGRATSGRRVKVQTAGRELDDIAKQLGAEIGDGDDASALARLSLAAEGLQEASPELFDSLKLAVAPMRTFTEKRLALDNFLSTGLGTTGLAAEAMDNQTDRLIGITTQLTPVIGVLADQHDQFKPIFTRLQRTANLFDTQVWDHNRQVIKLFAIVSFTPTRYYIRGDCPRYGELLGPSCYTAPDTPRAPYLQSALESMGITLPERVTENRDNFAPPRDSVRGAGQPPAYLPPEQDPANQPQHVPGGAPGPAPDAAPAEAPAEQPAPGSTTVAPASFGGNVGVVGSEQERIQLRQILGAPPSTADQVLLAPLARDTVVTVQQVREG